MTIQAIHQIKIVLKIIMLYITLYLYKLKYNSKFWEMKECMMKFNKKRFSIVKLYFSYLAWFIYISFTKQNQSHQHNWSNTRKLLQLISYGYFGLNISFGSAFVDLLNKLKKTSTKPSIAFGKSNLYHLVYSLKVSFQFYWNSGRNSIFV